MTVEKVALVTAGGSGSGADVVLSVAGSDRIAFAVKWAASVIQILGYTATGFGWTPWNLYFFLVGVIGWFAVGALWNDRAIMLIHLVALVAMVAGMSSA